MHKGIDIVEECNKADSCSNTVEAFKQALTSAPVLLISDVTKPFKLYTDACRVGRGLGAVLRQEAPGSSLVSLDSAMELECTALHDAMMHRKIHLGINVEFDATMDHHALVYMLTKVGGDVQTYNTDTGRF